METYTNMIVAACVAEQPRVAFKYFNIMMAENFTPTEFQFMTIFKLLFKLEHWEDSTHVYG